MHTTEIKSLLIDKINKIEDNHLLLEATRLINIEIPMPQEEFLFSDAQTIKIKNSLHQIENGEYLTSDQANKEIEKWLNE